MLMADLNVDLHAPAPDLRTHQVAGFLAANGMEDMLPHFHFRRTSGTRRHGAKRGTTLMELSRPPLDPELIMS